RDTPSTVTLESAGALAPDGTVNSSPRALSRQAVTPPLSTVREPASSASSHRARPGIERGSDGGALNALPRRSGRFGANAQAVEPTDQSTPPVTNCPVKWTVAAAPTTENV